MRFIRLCGFVSLVALSVSASANACWPFSCCGTKKPKCESASGPVVVRVVQENPTVQPVQHTTPEASPVVIPASCPNGNCPRQTPTVTRFRLN